MHVYLNGRTVPEAEATVSVLDRGFLFGDGVYEVFRAIDGRLFEAERHFARLDDGLAGLDIELDQLSREALPSIASRLLEMNAHTRGDATVYLQITRGVAPRAHAFPSPPVPPTVFLRTDTYVRPDAKRASGVGVILQPDQRWARCDLKTVNLLPNVLAKQAAAAAGAHEAVLVRDGVVREGSISACFGVMGGVVRTHPLGHAILPSVSRAVVLDLCAAHGIPVREEALQTAEMSDVDELFLAGTTIDVLPIVSVDGQPVGDGTPGPITRRLAAAFAELVALAPR
jgi:D-alanine transaminase